MALIVVRPLEPAGMKALARVARTAAGAELAQRDVSTSRMSGATSRSALASVPAKGPRSEMSMTATCGPCFRASATASASLATVWHSSTAGARPSINASPILLAS
jgi:hypothetical protein